MMLLLTLMDGLLPCWSDLVPGCCRAEGEGPLGALRLKGQDGLCQCDGSDEAASSCNVATGSMLCFSIFTGIWLDVDFAYITVN
jgi:hypothetical protein